jgi:rubrerythrin
MALDVLELRLAGLRSGEAIARTANTPGAIRDGSVVKDAWAKLQGEALLELRSRRAANGDKWTREELDQLETIFPQGGVLHRCPKCGVRRFADFHAAMCPACGWHPPLSLSEEVID